MADADTRWLQRFDNFQRALLVLQRGVQLAGERELSEMEQQGLIQGFAFTHELGRIDADLDDLLLPWVIDLSSLSAFAHEPLLEHIGRVGLVLYRRDPSQPSRPIAAAAARPGG